MGKKTAQRKLISVKDAVEGTLSEEIFKLLEHYKQSDPVGLPMKSVPDPFPVDDVKRSIGMGTLTMKNTQAYGFSKFRIKSVKIDMNALMVNKNINRRKNHEKKYGKHRFLSLGACWNNTGWIVGGGQLYTQYIVLQGSRTIYSNVEERCC